MEVLPIKERKGNNISKGEFVPEIEKEIYYLVNQERAKNNKIGLVNCNLLNNIADIKSADMGDRKYFSHISPNGKKITETIKANKIPFEIWGENIASLSDKGLSNKDVAKEFMHIWMKSSQYRDNILSNKFDKIGVGVYLIDGIYYATQEFLGSKNLVSAKEQSNIQQGQQPSSNKPGREQQPSSNKPGQGQQPSNKPGQGQQQSNKPGQGRQPVDNNKPSTTPVTNNGNNVVVPVPSVQTTNTPSKCSTPYDNESERGQFVPAIEQDIFKLINAERVKNNKSPLNYNSLMTCFAEAKSKDMGERNYFSHADLEGRYMWEFIKDNGISYGYWGENIAYIQHPGLSNEEIAKEFVSIWMNSPPHRENILSSSYTDTGIGVYLINGRYYATQEFFRPY